ncbi:MAG: hypothetical protein Q9220_007278 [cf. Caloplaca sp. 1 TL-2023]
MMQRLYLLALVSFCHTLAPVLAAGPLTPRANPSVQASLNVPNQPSQVNVPGTTISVILDKYQPVIPIEATRYLWILASAHYSIIKSILAAPNDPIIHTPNLEWHLGKPFISSNTREFKMTWEMLAHALQGIDNFYDNYGFMLLTATVLDHNLGWVGTIEVGSGYKGPGNSTAVE